MSNFVQRGAPERREEELLVEKTFNRLGMKTIAMQSPATMDGGDVLFTGKHLFAELSHRTNEHALEQLQQIFKNDILVLGIPVSERLSTK